MADDFDDIMGYKPKKKIILNFDDSNEKNDNKNDKIEQKSEEKIKNDQQPKKDKPRLYKNV